MIALGTCFHTLIFQRPSEICTRIQNSTVFILLFYIRQCCAISSSENNIFNRNTRNPIFDHRTVYKDNTYHQFPYENYQTANLVSISYVSEKKKGMFVLNNPSDAPLRGVLTCASLNITLTEKFYLQQMLLNCQYSSRKFQS